MSDGPGILTNPANPPRRVTGVGANPERWPGRGVASAYSRSRNSPWRRDLPACDRANPPPIGISASALVSKAKTGWISVGCRHQQVGWFNPEPPWQKNLQTGAEWVQRVPRSSAFWPWCRCRHFVTKSLPGRFRASVARNSLALCGSAADRLQALLDRRLASPCPRDPCGQSCAYLFENQPGVHMPI